MKAYRTKGVVPPGGRVRYRDPDDGWETVHPYYQRVVLLAHKHRVDTGLPIPHDWEEWVERAICEATPSACYDVPEVAASERHTWGGLALQFAKAMFTWASSGFAVTPWEQFKGRLEQCQGDADKGTPRCPAYHKSSGGFGFAHCGDCGCTRLKLFLGTEKCPRGKWGAGTPVP